MIELNGRTGDPAVERWLDATREVLQAGVTEKDLDNLLTAAIEGHTQQTQTPDFPENSGDTVYTELPPGLIDVRSASKKFGCPIGRIQNWVHRGRLMTYGRLKAPARGGGYLVVDESELVAYLSAPKAKGGRPPKT